MTDMPPIRDWPREETPEEAKQYRELVNHFQGKASKHQPRTDQLKLEKPHTMPNMMRLLKAHEQGPKAFDQEWDKVHAENDARNAK